MRHFIFAFISVALVLVTQSDQISSSAVYGKCAVNVNGACECTGSKCDYIEPIGALNDSYAVVYQTTKSGLRFKRSEIAFNPTNLYNETIEVNFDEKFQTMLGFGGAFTDAAAFSIGKLEPAAQDILYQLYFADINHGGISYSVGRVPIASCDFSIDVYSYDDSFGDYSMDNFSIQHDLDSGKIAMIQRALSLRNNSMSLFGSSWSPPAWMKTNQNRVQGTLNGTAGDSLHQSYALYLSKFLDAYKEQNVQFWAVSMQNEPAQDVRWDSCHWTAEQERDFIKLNLGPLMQRNHPDVAIMMLDDQRSELKQWTQTILSDPDAASFIAVAGVHWYSSIDDLLDEFEMLSETQKAFPNLQILATEACEGSFPWNAGPSMGNWLRGENYMHDIIGDVNNFAIGWTDWNIVLDLQGGPNHANNLVDAPILADTVGGKKFYKNPMYYAMGHFSAFVPKGSVRIYVKGPKADEQSAVSIEATGFITPDSNIVIVVLNRDTVHSRNLSIQHPSKGYINYSVPAGSMQTIVYKM